MGNRPRNIAVLCTGTGGMPDCAVGWRCRRGERYVRMLLDDSTKHTFAFWHAWGRSYEGALVIRRGDLTAGLRLLRAGFDELGEARSAFRYIPFLGTLAEALGRVGQVSDGLAAIDEALERSERTEELWRIAELLRIKGELVLVQGGSDAAAAAEDCCRRALDWAHRQGALSWELRTASSLARLWREQHRVTEARALLGSVYGRFTHDQIDDALTEIVTKARQKAGRRLYIYFSGHGHVSGESRRDVALCLPLDAQPTQRCAQLDRYLGYLEKCAPFTEIVMFLDCCRVKQVAAIGLPSSLDCPMAIGGGRKTMVAYASEFLKSAFEARSASGITGGGGGDEDAGSLAREDEEVHGHFTAAPLAGLWAGAVRPQGGATARTLKRYQEANVEQIAKAAGHAQRPQIPLDMEEDEADAMIFGSA